MVSATACDLSLNDPNIPTEDEVLNSSENMIRVGIGLQAEYSNQLAEPVYATGMVTNELGANPSTFESFRILDTGSGPATNDLGVSTGPWTGQYRVVRHANFLIDNAPTTVGLGPGYISGLVALGKLYKAMALGNVFQIYEQIVIETSLDAPFVDRPTAMAEILTLLDEAAAQLVTVPPAPEFTALVPAPGFNLPNTIQAMRARYNLIAGNLTVADAAAAAVSPTVFSEFRFSDSDANPLWNLYVNGGNSTSMRPKDAWRLAAEAGDQRVAYWVTPAALTGFAAPLDNFNRYSERTHSYPAYLPDEMKLIRAEVAARENRLVDALGFVNQVRTQCTSTLPEPVACLPALLNTDVPTQADILAEILEQRRVELYHQHVRWSDLRRFGHTPKFMWAPIPITECDRNAATPSALCQAEPANIPHDS
jgi:hypothetical protein